MLSDYPTLQLALRWQGNQDASLLQYYLPLADTVVKRWCDRPLETTVFSGSPAQGGSGPFAEWPDGSGVNELCLAQYPIRPVICPGTLTNGSPTITGLPSSGDMSTANMLARMPVTLHGQSMAAIQTGSCPIPAFTTLTTAPSGTTATMSANATAGGIFLLVFGLAAYLDFGALYGQGVRPGQSLPGASPTNSQLFMGSDYVLKVDETPVWGGGVSGGSESGILRRIGGAGSSWGAWSGWGFGDMGWGNRGGLTTVMPPIWPRSFGAIRVDYAAGYGIGATAPAGTLPSPCTIPPDLTDAVNKVAQLMMTIAPAGVPVAAGRETSEQAFRMIAFAADGNPQIATIRNMLSRYRKRSWGLGS